MGNATELEFTGERLVPEIIEYWALEHLHRYAISLDFIEDKYVVDIACGEGYGSNLLANRAKKVLGIDISSSAISHAEKKYKRENLSFIVGSAFDIPLEDKSVDVFVSFETIEHHDQHEKMLSEIKRVLKEHGIFIVSSPDKKNYSDIPNYKNPFHVKELYTEEFVAMLKRYFSNTFLLHQKSVLGSIISSGNKCGIGVSEFVGDYGHINSSTDLVNPLYNIAFVSDHPLPLQLINKNSIFLNKQMFEMYMSLKEQNKTLALENSRIKNSRAYSIGKMIIYPLRKLKTIFF